MVRLKHRYLLVDILYPDPSTWPSAPNPTSHSTTPHLQIHSPTSDALTPSLLAKLIRDEVAALFGDWGIGRLGGVGAGGVSVKYLSPATSTAIIRCPRASFRLVWTALACMARVPELGAKRGGGGGGAPPALTRACVFRVLRVSGTMRKAEEEAIRRARREIVRLQGMEEVGVLQGIVGDLEEEAGVRDGDDVVDVEMESDGED
ncbi:rpp14 family [Aspergillus terreus]|uniref:Ribonuclease P/MRP protein subunit POP5 n=1 Tax=Aspergillus terreus TaxID=33178 RepID=A0A5M3YUJ4_ASPTE|nr:hypothetical protein ATETN484_0004047100 [Aspergillus terreus]GFF13360.1 rpp14 family [Aspergillus terreus]